MKIHDLLPQQTTSAKPQRPDWAKPGTRVEDPTTGPQAELTDAAKQFESVILTRLLNEMQNTIGEWGMEKDSGSKQMQGIFWMHLGEEIGKQGGLGLWKNLVQSLDADPSTKTTASLDTNL